MWERLLGGWLGIYKKSVTDILYWGRKCLCAQILLFKKSRALSAHYLLRAGLDSWLSMMCDTGPLSSCVPTSDRWQKNKYDMKSAFTCQGAQKKAALGAMTLFWTGCLGTAPWRCHLPWRLSEGHGRPFKWLLTGNFILITVSTSSGHQDTSSLLLISYFALWKVSLCRL